jgi:peptide/nickel transport system ATP-binding protein
MLDVSIRMGILNLLARLRKEQDLAVLLITHDLASARYLADRILVLYCGRVVEDGPSDAVVNRPAHPYTRALLDAIADGGRSEPATPPSSPTAELRAMSGCPFASRCPETLDACREIDPLARAFDGRMVRCHLYPVGERKEGAVR